MKRSEFVCLLQKWSLRSSVCGVFRGLLECILSLRYWAKKCINHPSKRCDHPKTRNCPFWRGQKSATNPLGKRSPHTGNAYFNRPRHKKGLPYVQSSKSALWFPFACFVNCCFFAIFVRCLALNPLLLPAPPRLWQPPPQGCDAHTHVGGGGNQGSLGCNGMVWVKGIQDKTSTWFAKS